MNNEEKILEAIGQLRDDFGTRFDKIEAQFDGIDARFDRIDSRFDKIDSHFDRIDSRFDSIDSHFDKIEADISAIRTLVDIDLGKRLDSLLEGQQAILDAMAPKERVEKLEEKYLVLETVVKTHSHDIAELKKAL